MARVGPGLEDRAVSGDRPSLGYRDPEHPRRHRRSGAIEELADRSAEVELRADVDRRQHLGDGRHRTTGLRKERAHLGRRLDGIAGGS